MTAQQAHRVRIELNRRIVRERIWDIPTIVRLYREAGLRHPADKGSA